MMAARARSTTLFPPQHDFATLGTVGRRQLRIRDGIPSHGKFQIVARLSTLQPWRHRAPGTSHAANFNLRNPSCTSTTDAVAGNSGQMAPWVPPLNTSVVTTHLPAVFASDPSHPLLIPYCQSPGSRGSCFLRATRALGDIRPDVTLYSSRRLISAPFPSPVAH
jgi:hypothetical protein